MGIRTRLALLVLSAVSALKFAGAQEAVAAKPLNGVVVAKENGTPLEHAMVTVQPALRQTFTSGAGTFVFSELPPGTYRIRVAHLGFVPREIVVTIPASSAPDRVQVELTLITVHLPTMKVLANWTCTNPGPPDPAYDPDFAAVVGQLRINAEQYRLLADSFPFAYRIYREYSATDGAKVRKMRRIDTVTYASNAAGWRYKVGNVVGEDAEHNLEMRLPILSDFASDVFLNSHCFRYAGRDSSSDGAVLRIEFRAVDSLKVADVNGTILLDAVSYQIRNTTLDLSRIPITIRGITSVSARTTFTAVAPNIVVFSEIIGTNFLTPSRDWRANVFTTEQQHILKFEWLHGAPGKSVTPPPRQ
jgi:hypothetical protein